MSSDQSGPELPSRTGRALSFDEFSTRTLYIVIFGLASISPAQSDLWWLLRAGQDIWRSHRVSLVDRYSHTADGRYWSNHEWLWETASFGIHWLGGMPLLSAWVGATVAATVWAIRRCSHATGYVVPIMLLFLIPAISASWTARPQVTSMLFFALTVLLLGREKYWWLPVLFLLWANMHAQVVMGGLVLAFALALAVVRHLVWRTPEDAGRATRLALATTTSAVMTLFTPLGPRLWTYVLDANGRPGQDKITEWRSAFHPGAGSTVFWIVLATVLGALLLRRDRLRSWSSQMPLLATAAMTPLAILAVRNIPFFLLASMPLLMTLLEFHSRRAPGRVPRSQILLGSLAALTGLGVALVWAAPPPTLRWHPVSRSLASALRACPGPLYNDYNEGAALVWWVPDVEVFIDNRQDPYPADVIEAGVDLERPDYPAVFDRYDIRCAYVARSAPLEDALRHDGWTARYEDDTSVVLVPPSTP